MRLAASPLLAGLAFSALVAGLATSCAISFPDYPLGAGGSTGSSNSSSGTTQSTSTSVSGSSSSGCGDTMGNPMNCGSCGNVCGTANAVSVSCSAGKCVFACNSNFAHCGSSDAAGCNADLTSAATCGACGHDCLGGTCTSGKCGAAVIAMGQASPSAIALDKDHVYWTNYDGGDIRMLAKTAPISTMPSAVVTNAPAQLASLVTDGAVPIFGAAGSNASTVYYATYVNGAFKVDTTGMGIPMSIGQTNSVISMAISDTYVLWAHGFVGGTPPVMVSRYNTATKMNDTLATGPNMAEGSGIVADNAVVYWAETGNGGIFERAAGSTSCDEATTCQRLTPATSPFTMAIDQNNVYWSDLQSPPGIYAASKSGGNVTKLATAAPAVLGLASDGTNLYWVQGDKTVRMTSVTSATPCTAGTGAGACAILDGPPASGANQPTAIAVDDQAIYWAFGTNGLQTGTITRLVK